jgi:phage terminase large subunit-like protein
VKHRRNSENDKVDAVVASVMALGQFYADNQTETGEELAEIINL